MTTAKDVIRLVIEDIDSEIRMLKSSLNYAEAKNMMYKDERQLAMSAGLDFVRASVEYDYSIGFHAGAASECKYRINALKRKRDYYVSLGEIYAEEGEENE